MADFGYDVADYCGVDSCFGTLVDSTNRLFTLVARLILLDFVPNHSSDRHPWFAESRSSRDNPKRDWYIWRDRPDGGPPNNWISDSAVLPGNGYAHWPILLPCLPEGAGRPQLAQSRVRAAMIEVMRFWFDRGVDGFRIDVLGTWSRRRASPTSAEPRLPAGNGRKAAVPAAFHRPAGGARLCADMSPWPTAMAQMDGPNLLVGNEPAALG